MDDKDERKEVEALFEWARGRPVSEVNARIAK